MTGCWPLQTAASWRLDSSMLRAVRCEDAMRPVNSCISRTSASCAQARSNACGGSCGQQHSKTRGTRQTHVEGQGLGTLAGRVYSPSRRSTRHSMQSKAKSRDRHPALPYPRRPRSAHMACADISTRPTRRSTPPPHTSSCVNRARALSSCLMSSLLS